MNQPGISIRYWGFRLAMFGGVMLLTACSNGSGDKTSSSGDEGTPSAPVTLTVGTSHTGSIAQFGTSYYRFTTAANSAYRISLTNTNSDLSWELFSNPDYIGFIKYCDNILETGDEVCTSGSALTAGTTYYLSVDEDDGVAGTYKLLVETITTLRALRAIRFEAEGVWSLCKFDSTVGQDVDDVLTITGTVLARTEVHVSSTDGSCSGSRVSASTLTYTLADAGTVTLNHWSNGTDVTAAPSSADGNPGVAAPSVTHVLTTSSTGAQEPWGWFVDDSIPSKARLYHSSATPSTPCAATSDGYAQCLMSTEYYTRQ